MKTKKFNVEASDRTIIFQADKPTICPVCSAFCEPTKTGIAVLTELHDHIYLLQFRNECCDSFIYCLYHVNTSKKSGKLLTVYPSLSIKENLPDNIKNLPLAS